MSLAPVDCRVVTPHGQDIASVFSALKHKKITATTLSYCLSPGGRQGSLVPVQMGIVPTIPATTKPAERILALLKITLIPLLDQILSSVKSPESSARIQIMLVMPAKSSVRYSYCPEVTLQNFIYDHLNAAQMTNAAQGCSITFIHEDQDLISFFVQAQTALYQGYFDRLIFGGVDSFLTVKAIRAFEARQSIRKEGNPDAPLLGEGAAFISMSNQAPLFAKALDTGNIPKTLSDMPHSSYWITNRSVRLRAEFDWYESMRNYPNFRNLSELNLQKWVGHLGAAQLPLQLALGFHWASMQAENSMRFDSIILYNENTEKQLILQKYRCFQRPTHG